MTAEAPIGSPPSDQGEDLTPRARSIAGNAAIMMAAQLMTWGLALIVTVALPRHLGPEALGQLRLAGSWWLVAAVAVTFGTTTVLTRNIARDRTSARVLIGPAIGLQLCLYAGSWIAIGLIAAAMGYDRQLLVLIGLIGISVLFQPIAGTARAALNGFERLDYIALGDVATKLAHVLVVIALIVGGFGVYAFAAATTVYTAGGALALVIVLRRYGIRVIPRWRGILDLGRSSRSFMVSDLTVVTYQQIDIIIIAMLVDDTVLGWYGTAEMLFGALLFIPSALLAALFPVFSRLHLEEGSRGAEMLRRNWNMLIVVAVPVGLGTVAMATPIAELLFGARFSGAGPVLAVMGVVLIVTYMTILLGRYAHAVDQQRIWIRMMVGAILATVALDVLLVPWADRVFGNGAIGGAVAYLVTETCMLALGIRVLAPQLVSRESAIRLGKCLLAGLVMMAAVWPLRESFVALPVGVGICVYVMMVGLLRILDDEEIGPLGVNLRRLRNALGRVGHREALS